MVNKIEKGLQQYLQSQTDRVFDLSRYSHARIGMGHTGGHLKYQDWLAFQTGFCQAKDAVFSQYPVDELHSLCKTLNLAYVDIHSKASDGMLFITRPDLGKQLAEESEIRLKQLLDEHTLYCNKDILIIISGGLSPFAIRQQMMGFLPLFIQELQQQNWTISPVILNPRGRVALGDQLNSFFKAQLVVMLIGERPGLSTADSMGIYFTYQARPGFTDEQRNCISNIHQHGLSHVDAVTKLICLLTKAKVNRISGIALKDGFINLPRL